MWGIIWAHRVECVHVGIMRVASVLGVSNFRSHEAKVWTLMQWSEMGFSWQTWQFFSNNCQHWPSCVHEKVLGFCCSPSKTRVCSNTVQTLKTKKRLSRDVLLGSNTRMIGNCLSLHLHFWSIESHWQCWTQMPHSDWNWTTKSPQRGTAQLGFIATWNKTRASTLSSEKKVEMNSQPDLRPPRSFLRSLCRENGRHQFMLENCVNSLTSMTLQRQTNMLICHSLGLHEAIVFFALFVSFCPLVFWGNQFPKAASEGELAHAALVTKIMQRKTVHPNNQRSKCSKIRINQTFNEPKIETLKESDFPTDWKDLSMNWFVQWKGIWSLKKSKVCCQRKRFEDGQAWDGVTFPQKVMQWSLLERKHRQKQSSHADERQLKTTKCVFWCTLQHWTPITKNAIEFEVRRTKRNFQQKKKNGESQEKSSLEL